MNSTRSGAGSTASGSPASRRTASCERHPVLPLSVATSTATASRYIDACITRSDLQGAVVEAPHHTRGCMYTRRRRGANACSLGEIAGDVVARRGPTRASETRPHGLPVRSRRLGHSALAGPAWHGPWIRASDALHDADLLTHSIPQK